MLRISNLLARLNMKGAEITDYSRLQIVRWRKPRWLPTAKTKLFKVPPRRVIPEGEELEVRRLFNNYRNHVNSIRTYLISKYSTENLASADPEEQSRIFIEDLNHCVEINEKWNKQQRISREKRVNEELEKDIQFAKERLELELLKEEQKQELVEEIVRKQKSILFLTENNIDAAIEKALTNEVDYNYAIDLDGQKIVGRDSTLQNFKERGNVKQ